MKKLISIDTLFLEENERWLMYRILFYAKKYDYTKYTSTLVEPWRLSIVGLTDSLSLLLQKSKAIPQMSPDETYNDDPPSMFGVKEAKLHRSRGVNLSMFFSLFKYYRQTYIDLLDGHIDEIDEDYDYICDYLNRFFDRVETSFVTEWAGSSSEKQIHELSIKNLKLANEKNRYLTLFDSIDNPAIVLNDKFIIENCNLVASSLFFNIENAGSYYYSKQEEINISTFLDLELVKACKQFEWKYEDNYFLVFPKVLHDISGKNEGYIILFSDISKLKQSEDILMAQSKYAAMGEMISLIAHQWRQPVTAISMNINNILADIELDLLNSNGLKENCESVLKQTVHLSKTIDDFRDFFKPKKDKEIIKISNLLEDVNSILGKSLQYNNITFTISIKDDIEVVIYPRELIQVILAIINNSKEALIEKEIGDKCINISIIKDGETLVIKIQDNAGGIPEDIMRKIFEPYFSTKKEKNGTGLGLYISMSIIKKHFHGDILAENQESGACFKVVVPIEG